MNGELLRDLVLASAGITASAAGAALLVIRVMLSPSLSGGSYKPGNSKRH